MCVFIQGYIGLEFVKEYLLETDLSEENWSRLPFKDDMLIHVKKAFSQEDRAAGKAAVLHSYRLMCTHCRISHNIRINFKNKRKIKKKTTYM